MAKTAGAEAGRRTDRRAQEGAPDARITAGHEDPTGVTLPPTCKRRGGIAHRGQRTRGHAPTTTPESEATPRRERTRTAGAAAAASCPQRHHGQSGRSVERDRTDPELSAGANTRRQVEGTSQRSHSGAVRKTTGEGGENTHFQSAHDRWSMPKWPALQGVLGHREDEATSSEMRGSHRRGRTERQVQRLQVCLLRQLCASRVDRGTGGTLRWEPRLYGGTIANTSRRSKTLPRASEAVDRHSKFDLAQLGGRTIRLKGG